jgi:hypothetical protein
VKTALVAPAGTVTVVGTTTFEVLLSRAIASPPLGAPAVSVTVQTSVPAPVIESLAQISELADGFGAAAWASAVKPVSKKQFRIARSEARTQYLSRGAAALGLSGHEKESEKKG